MAVGGSLVDRAVQGEFFSEGAGAQVEVFVDKLGVRLTAIFSVPNVSTITLTGCATPSRGDLDLGAVGQAAAARFLATYRAA